MGVKRMENMHMEAKRKEAKRMGVKTPVLTALYGYSKRSRVELSS